MKPEHKKIIDHLSRLEGQIDSIKNELRNEKPDCIKASQTLHSASRSFAGVRSLFVETFLYGHFLNSKLNKSDTLMLEQLLKLIKG